jgi:hypothetical protein
VANLDPDTAHRRAGRDRGAGFRRSDYSEYIITLQALIYALLLAATHMTSRLEEVGMGPR